MTAPFGTEKQIDKAKAFLREALAGGARARNELIEAGQARGISPSTLARARVALKITSRRDRATSAYFWRLRKPRAASAQAPFQLITQQEG